MKKGKKRVIPGFGLTMGVTITMLSIVVLIPLASLVVYSSQLGLGEFFEVITRKRVLSSFYVSFITALGASLVNAVMGLILAWVLVRYEFPGQADHGWHDRTSVCTADGSCGYFADFTDSRSGANRKLFREVGDKIAYTKLGITFALILCGNSFCCKGSAAGS